MPVIVKVSVLPFVKSIAFPNGYDDKFFWVSAWSEDIKRDTSFSFALAGAAFSMRW
jgi:hypothetical protein